MICNKCKKRVAVNKSVCPYCNNSLVKKVHSSNTGSKNKFLKDDNSNLVGGTVTKGKGTMVKIKKNSSSIKNNTNIGNMKSSNTGSKNKYIKNDNTELIGGTTTKGSFLKLEKQKKNKVIPTLDMKKYHNAIDYKEAKADIEEKRLQLDELKKSKYSEEDVSTKIFSIEKVKRSSKIGKELLKHRTDYSDMIGGKTTNKYGSGIDAKKKREVKKQEETFSGYSKTFGFPIQNKGIEVTDVVIHNPSTQSKRDFKKEFNFLSYAVVLAVWLIAIVLLVNNVDIGYYFSENNGLFSSNIDGSEYLEYDGVSKSGQTGEANTGDVTSIVHDNQYLAQFPIKNEASVYELIVADSIKQKENCPTDILEIEEEIINNYGITAVNLCEMDETFAKELRDVVKYIYNEFPEAKNYLTNLTLANVDSSSSYMAAFMPIFTFATSNSNTGYPVAIKTQILLNAKYFLNPTKINNSVDYGVRSGYFPANATRSSTVAHEFGHYLSYVALLNYYKSDKLNFVEYNETSLLYQIYDDFNIGNYSLLILEEAYNNYIKSSGSTMSFYQFRESISQYAVAKNKNGSYIYDETIAEAFHDYYINGYSASSASIAVMNVLRNKL